MIQRNYRAHRRCTMLPKVIREYKMRNANMIQKYMRGYIHWNKMNKVLIEHKLTKHDKFYKKMKIALEKESVEFIEREYLKYTIRKI